MAMAAQTIAEKSFMHHSDRSARLHADRTHGDTGLGGHFGQFGGALGAGRHYSQQTDQSRQRIYRQHSESPQRGVNRNTCFTLCMSTNAGDPKPTCTAAPKPDWNK